MENEVWLWWTVRASQGVAFPSYAGKGARFEHKVALTRKLPAKEMRRALASSSGPPKKVMARGMVTEFPRRPPRISPSDAPEEGWQEPQEEPQKFTVLDTCASLQVYANLMIDGFAGMPAKLARMWHECPVREESEVHRRGDPPSCCAAASVQLNLSWWACLEPRLDLVLAAAYPDQTQCLEPCAAQRSGLWSVQPDSSPLHVGNRPPRFQNWMRVQLQGKWERQLLPWA